MFKTLQSLSALLEAKHLKVKEPGWYVVDHMDKAVEGPMQERAAHERADELNAGRKGDITPYDVSYFTDYEIRRMNESLNESMIDDVDEPGWYASDSNTGRVVEGPVAKKSDLSAEVRDAEGGAINITHIAVADLSEAQELNEGFMDFTVHGSDSAADLHHEALDAAAKKLRAGLKDKGNEFNTHGTLNVAMILVQRYAKEINGYSPIHDLAVDVHKKLKAEVEHEQAKNKANRRIAGDYLNAMEKIAKQLGKLLSKSK